MLFNNTRPGKRNGFISTRFGSSPFQPLPAPTGTAPFRLPIGNVLGRSHSKTKMVFHSMGDTGGIKDGSQQKIVADKLEQQFREATNANAKPQFLYHLGDVVYFNGEEANYNDQFFDPYMHYPAPIFAIPGNHDGDVDLSSPHHAPSLKAFVEVFCDTKSRKLRIAGESVRTSMIQPNVYWTLQAPLANIIGLYSNVPEHGVIKNDQRAWFIGELKNAQKERKAKAIIVTVHHPPYSIDKQHGSSGTMKSLLDGAFAETGIYPDLVLSGHVHNYQRFTRTYPNGRQVPYIIAGAGGYHHLHYVDSKAAPIYVPNDTFFDNVTIEEFCDDRFGFMRISIEKKGNARTLTGEYFTVPRVQESWRAPAELYDYFSIDLQKGKLTNKKH
jgi:predicted MPP superfamily phosphohydrolase